jgi:hypothetical protein
MNYFIIHPLFRYCSTQTNPTCSYYNKQIIVKKKNYKENFTKMYSKANLYKKNAVKCVLNVTFEPLLEWTPQICYNKIL